MSPLIDLNQEMQKARSNVQIYNIVLRELIKMRNNYPDLSTDHIQNIIFKKFDVDEEFMFMMQAHYNQVLIDSINTKGQE